MRLSVRTKQIAAVTGIVFGAVALMGVLSLFAIADVLVKETHTRADLLASGIFNRASALALEGGDFRESLAGDAGLRSILQMAGMSKNAMFAAIVDTSGVAIAHSDMAQTGSAIARSPTLDSLVSAGMIEKLKAIYTEGGRTFEFQLPLILDTTDFGMIHVAASTLLIRSDLEEALGRAALTAALLLVASVLIATLLARWTLRPILLIRAGLARLGRGEAVTLALSQTDEYGDLGESFNVVSARLAEEQAEGRVSRATVSKRLAALGRVSSGIAHEVKNPLNAMGIHLELLRLQLNEADAPQDHVQVLAQQMRRLDEVVQGFLTFARPDPLTLADVSVSKVLEELRPIILAEAGKTGVKVVIECAPDLPPVQGDEGQLHQAFLNLAINGCQAMPDGGQCRVSARRADRRQLEVRFEDTGTGIAPENLDKIFNLYFTTKPEGSGVGLALVYRTIHLHNGDIEVESVPGEGTTFRVTLPFAEGPMPS
jgi:signal transduction histidine kinase